jgi:hypothetical protein
MESLQSQFRKQYGPKGIYAGASQFHDYWSRDSLFACFGALALKDYEQVRKTLTHFLDNLDETGHVPLRIGAKNEVLKYLGLPTKDGVWHTQDKGSNESYDGNALLLIVAEKYEQYAKKKLPREKLQRVLNWILAHEQTHLLHQGPYACWEDSIKITGPRLYTNVCHYRSLIAASRLFNDKTYATRAAKTKLALQTWWDKKYFTDGPYNKACMSAGNVLAIIWGVATKEQGTAILRYIGRRETACPPAGFWQPTMRQAYIPFFFIHLQDYHGWMEWTWLAAIEIVAYKINGNEKKAALHEDVLRALVKHDGTMYEVYRLNFPVKRLFYRSEKSFAWALGLFIASAQPKVLQ